MASILFWPECVNIEEDCPLARDRSTYYGTCPKRQLEIRQLNMLQATFLIKKVKVTRGPFYIHYKVWDEITYPFLNFNSATVEV